MGETLVRFETPVASADGTTWHARACGEENADGLWDGWIEFTSAVDGRSITSNRETTQPNRRDTEYWATGLTPVYLQGAFQRAVDAAAARSSERDALSMLRKP